ncbi:helix-hairpin-helix domain-containing protein [Sulfurovum mangrovi]|uniref:helix-hairpin-helix domain-containing protein n=1 Tax=Sulfurovum mangrovi TaxID=2893889 RepID=UPI001E5FA875|nr:helix-hairpin-helix domain-containing protein [Sulfurovum mangrovi]UFH59676.1 helix-hairpin-helix domain-containing protein [Sulfurovum mangrovi]UFH60821.1 helix-hairpin-helix domain-containing protein [Sulfurovum mangrovi]
MNPKKVVRETTKKLTDLPNIGKSLAADLERIGIDSPEKLQGKEPYALYQRLSEVTGKRQDPCVLDIFISITDFMNGGEPKVWWAYTAERKEKYKI